jgi:catechol 2,3-dioxygenase-like lactoylglutathione lyase family enzyme
MNKEDAMPDTVLTQTTGVHHITLNGADRQTSIDFWEGVLGMPFVFEQPNLDAKEVNHLYFDPGDGRLITIFTSEERKPTDHQSGVEPGAVHHIAFAIAPDAYEPTIKRLRAAGHKVAVRDRGFMWSMYFREPLGHLIELAAYKFTAPDGHSDAEVLAEAYRLRLARGADAIETEDVEAAVRSLQS